MTTLKKLLRVYNHGAGWFKCVALGEGDGNDVVHLTNYDKVRNTVYFHNVRHREHSQFDIPFEKALVLTAEVVIDELKKDK